MIHQKLKILAIFCLITQVMIAVEQVNFEQKYQTTLEQFFDLTSQDLESQIHKTPAFLLQFHQTYKQVIKTLHQDIQLINQKIKNLKRQQESALELELLHNRLKNLYNFLKKHRLPYEVVTFHESVKHHWNLLFQAVAQGKDIVLFLKDFDIETVDHESLRQLAKMVSKDLRKIETYEYRLHADWIDIKLANYVLKIELTRLRNAILFHPLYKRTKLKLLSSYPR